MPYTIHEPTPTYPPAIPHGRGGAGNRARPLPPSTLKTPPANTLHINTPNFSTGRGGVGNMHTSSASDRRMFSFDEELAKQGKAIASPVYHIGRGGQGNAVQERRRESDASGSSKGSGSGKGSLEWVRGLARTGRS